MHLQSQIIDLPLKPSTGGQPFLEITNHVISIVETMAHFVTIGVSNVHLQ